MAPIFPSRSDVKFRLDELPVHVADQVRSKLGMKPQASVSSSLSRSRCRNAQGQPVGVRDAASAATRSKRRDREGEQQAAAIAQFRLEYPMYAGCLIHIPNGGSRANAFEGWRLKQQGVRAGTADLFLAVPRGSSHGLWIEVKAAKPYDSAVTEAQKGFLEDMRVQGYQALLCRGADEILSALRAYLSQPSK